VVGNSMGGRVALELGFSYPERVDRLALLSPSLAWKRDRPWVRVARLARPELGLIQFTPRPAVEAVVRRLIPGGMDGWAAVGLDEFLRVYCTPRGRAAFYAAARQIYLEEANGPDGFWTRLATLQNDSLFVWGKQDKIVPIRFARHVEEVLPAARHVELDCGHVPQVERPAETHRAIRNFLRTETRERVSA
jgi:pimeloyl-ACP methyl ester carboxylesterase